jgi:hypothetical protein
VSGAASRTIELTDDEVWIARLALADFAQNETDASVDYEDRPEEKAELLRQADVALSVIERLT